MLVLASAALLYASTHTAELDKDRALLRRLGHVRIRSTGINGAETDETRPVTPFDWKQVFVMRPLDDAIAQAGLEISPPLLLLIMSILFGTAFLIVGRRFHLAIGLGCSVMIGIAPLFYLRFRGVRRLRTFGQQLPYVLDLMKSGLESGHTLLRSLQMTTRNLPEPIAGELRRVVDQVQVGMTLQQALDNMYRRVPGEDLGFLVAAIRIQATIGSSLAQILEHVSQSVRNRQRLDQQIRTLTAQSRASAIIVTLLPAVVLGAFTLVRPDYAQTLFYDPLGIKLLQTAIVLDVLALIAMQRIARIEY
jgi:tight adherence protein B